MELPQGWFDQNDQEVYRRLYNKLPANAMVAELGVAKGRSICSVADIIKEKNLIIHAVDTFEGTENEGQAHADAKTTDWEQVFKDNIKAFGLSKNVIIHKGRTDKVYKEFANKQFDLLFIDADHSTEAVVADLKHWRPKLKSNGVLCGHDWLWPSVRKGIETAGLEVINDGNMWYLLPYKASKKPLFSICLIARNEEKFLPRAIASLKEFLERGGEVVLVDTGSTDKTADIALKAGFVVERVGEKYLTRLTKEQAQAINDLYVVEGEAPVVNEGETVFNFAEARNHAANLATNDMVAMLDCDEAYTNLDIDELNKLIQQGHDQFEYNFVFAHSPDGLPTITFTQSKFYDKTKAEWKGGIHEFLSGKGHRKMLPKETLYLEHWQNHETDRSGYLRGLALGCYNEPTNDRYSHYFAREMFYTGRYRSAIDEFEQHITMGGWPAERGESYALMGLCYEALGENDKAVECFHKSIQTEAGRRKPFILLAEHYFRLNDHLRTACYAEAALQIKQDGFYANNAEHYRHTPHRLAYWAHWYLGNKEKSKYHFDQAFKYQPDSQLFLNESKFYYQLPTVSFIIPHLGREEGLKKCLASIEALDYPKELIDVCVIDDEEPTVPEKVKMGVERTRGEYVVYGANDMEFTPQSVKIAILASLIREKDLIAFHEFEVCPDKGNICTHFVIKRELIQLIGGEVFDTDFVHAGVDSLLYAKCEKLGEAWHEDRAKIIHHHFGLGADYDWVYQRGWKHCEADRKLLEKKLALI